MISAVSRINPRMRNLEKTVDADVVEPVVEDAKHQETDDRVADASLSAEQACPSDNHSRHRVQKIGVELLLLGAAEIRDPQHAGHTRADR